jgi:hypothetical protein
MPPAGTAAVEAYQIPQPTLLTLPSITTSTASNTIWTIWNHVYGDTATASFTTSTATTTGNLNPSVLIWGAWNAQLQGAILTNSPSIIQGTASAVGSAATQIINTVSSTAVWGQWNAAYAQMQMQQAAAQLRQATPEQVEQARRQAERYQQEQAVRMAEQSEAEKRAEMLLQSVLDPAQREELKERGFFTLETIAKNGERRIYRIKRGRSHNVEQVDASGRRIKTLCAHPRASVPNADTMVVQKLMLESQEEEFLRIANQGY